MFRSVFSFFKVILLVLTVFSSVDKSFGFSTPVSPSVPALSLGRTVARSPTCLCSTVVDSPTETKKIEVIKEDVVEEEKKAGGAGWEIQLYNDPYNHRTFVAKCLCQICGKTDTESYQIMMQAHKNGMGVVGRYHYEIAELYYGSLREEGLTVRMVEVDDE
mmetsp:Transcript_3291/g.7824  ORF Transcript_3291/g.7824 Transcript_3291/m.7824 type:complete len:161 (-) Transcript_3291:378-860(-)